MTLQDLKENRQIIIETIEAEVGSEMVKETMTKMVNFLGFSGIRSTDVVSYVKEVISLCEIKPYEKPFVNTLWGPGCKHSTQDEYQTACLRQKISLRA